jgi:hypothetical protein
LLALHRKEAVEELVQSVPRFKMGVQRFHGDPCPYDGSRSCFPCR